MSNRKAHRRYLSFRRCERSVPVRYRNGRFTSKKMSDDDRRYFLKRAIRRRLNILLAAGAP